MISTIPLTDKAKLLPSLPRPICHMDELGLRLDVAWDPTAGARPQPFTVHRLPTAEFLKTKSNLPVARLYLRVPMKWATPTNVSFHSALIPVTMTSASKIPAWKGLLLRAFYSGRSLHFMCLFGRRQVHVEKALLRLAASTPVAHIRENILFTFPWSVNNCWWCCHWILFEIRWKTSKRFKNGVVFFRENRVPRLFDLHSMSLWCFTKYLSHECKRGHSLSVLPLRHFTSTLRHPPNCGYRSKSTFTFAA